MKNNNRTYIKILAIANCGNMMGANRALVSLIIDMKNRYDVDFDVLIPKEKKNYGGSLIKVLEDNSIQYYISDMRKWVGVKGTRFFGLKSIRNLLYTEYFGRKIAKMIRENSYDLIYTNSSTIQYGAVIAKKCKLPHVWHIREFCNSDYKMEFIFPKKKKAVFFKSAKYVIAISDAISNYIKKDLCSEANVIRIYDGISAIKENEYLHKNDGKFRLVNVGVLIDGKNQLELLEALRIVIGRGYDNIEVNFIGEGDAYKCKLEDYINKYGLNRYVQFLGYKENVASILSCMDVGVICSKSEGFGLVTCEYMMASLPVIGSNSGATGELIKNGITGYLYELGDVKELAGCIIELYTDKEKVKNMGREAYKHVNKHFVTTQNTDQMYNVFIDSIQK